MTDKLNVLLLGSGGRECAFSWKISQSGQNVNISETDFEAIKVFVLNNGINMVVVGPEAPLVEGIYDFFIADPEIKSIPVIGPSKLGATLEGSKDFSKQFMFRHNVPTAQYKTFNADTLSPLMF
jgi:phosphoribosylamine--glycine ligase